MRVLFRKVVRKAVMEGMPMKFPVGGGEPRKAVGVKMRGRRV